MPNFPDEKLKLLNNESISLLNIIRKIDLTTSPNHPRVSFPDNKYTPSFSILDYPSLGKTLGTTIPCNNEISEIKDLSSDPNGVCMVTTNVYGRWNSHAGSHADQPAHWLKNSYGEEFDDKQYTGVATVLNLAPKLEKKSNPKITRNLLIEAASDTDLNLEKIRRLVVRTYKQTPDQWDNNFAFLDQEAAKFLAELPKLVLFGTDAPSVDAPKASPIIKHAHGELWNGKVAILEGLESNNLPNQLRYDGVICTFWNPMHIFIDAKGALVYFFEIADVYEQI